MLTESRQSFFLFELDAISIPNKTVDTIIHCYASWNEHPESYYGRLIINDTLK